MPIPINYAISLLINKMATRVEVREFFNYIHDVYSDEEIRNSDYYREPHDAFMSEVYHLSREQFLSTYTDDKHAFYEYNGVYYQVDYDWQEEEMGTEYYTEIDVESHIFMIMESSILESIFNLRAALFAAVNYPLGDYLYRKIAALYEHQGELLTNKWLKKVLEEAEEDGYHDVKELVEYEDLKYHPANDIVANKGSYIKFHIVVDEYTNQKLEVFSIPYKPANEPVEA